MTDDILQNPCSLIGSTKRIVRLFRDFGLEGWKVWLGWTASALLLLIAWALVLIVYAFLTGFAILWIPWAIWTLNRRHHIHADRRAIMAAGGPGTAPGSSDGR